MVAKPVCLRPVRLYAVRAAALCVACALAPATAAQPTVDAGAEVAYDSNVTRAQLRDDLRSDGYASGHATWTWRTRPSDFDALDAGVALRGAQYARFPRLSYAAADATLGWQRKLGIGLTQPWIGASATLSREDYREDTRDSDRLELRIEAGKRWTEQLDTSAGYAFDRRYTRRDAPVVRGISGKVWDLKGNSGFARMGYALTDRWLTDFGLSIRRGDVVSTTHRNLAIFLASDAIAESDAFGPEFYDYRLRGTTRTGSGTLSYALGERASLNLLYTYGFTRAAQGLEYQDHFVSAAWIYRY